MLRVETDQKFASVFCKWLASRFDDEVSFDAKTTRTIGHVEFVDGKINILAAAALHHWSTHSVEITVASSGEKRQKNSREFIHAIFSYVFDVAKRSSLWATIDVRNDKCMALAEAMGFTKRAHVPDFFGANNDGFVYTLTKTEWQRGKWSENNAGQINTQVIATNNNNRETVH
jgi:RimJ/RimL family protein N-acetyltransferase